MAGPIRIAILANGTQARREIGQVNTALGGLGRLARGGLAAAGIGGLAVGIAGFAKSAVNAEAEFSTSMRMIQAATKAPQSAMGQLNDLAIKLGQDTSFSAGEAADAMLELAKAGLDTKTIMGGGVAGTLQLAAAGGTDLATAATIASNALNAFGLKGRDMASIAAALAGGANASSASVESLGQGLSQVGPGAVNAGLSLQQTVAALSAFDAAGIKGSDAGTSLKTMLARLVPQTNKAADAMEAAGLNFTTADGDFRSLEQIAGQLQDRLGGLSRVERQRALNTIFGSDASRAATVLMREGADGIRDYVRATKDQNAAQEMAESRMSGTAGALERLSGTVETAKLRLGQELAPVVQSTADSLGENLVPAMEKTIEVGKTVGDALEPAWKGIKLLGGLAGDAVGFLADLPGPVQEIAVQAGVAALVLPRLSTAVSSATSAVALNIARLQQWRAEMTYSATRAQNVATAMQRLGGAARTAAGVGGMVALTQASQTSNESLGLLGKTAGGALMGFSLAGPWGAAVGAGAGALWGLKDAMEGVNYGAQHAREATANYKGTLDELTGAATRATREMVLQKAAEAGVLSLAGRLDVNTRDLIGSVLGQEGATRRLTAAYRANSGELSGSEQATFATWLRNNTDALADQGRGIRDNNAALVTWKEALRGLPPEAKTEIKALGATATIQQVRNLARQYGLNPERLLTRVEAAGIGVVGKNLRQLRRDIRETGNTRPGDAWVEFFGAGVRRAQGVGRRGSNDINRDLGRVGNTRPSRAWDGSLSTMLNGGKRDASGATADVNRFLGRSGDVKPSRAWIGSLSAAINDAEGTASSGGRDVGSDLGSGINSGIGSWIGTIASSAANLVSGAIAAARRAADSRSPSRKMIALGEDMGEGLTIGLSLRERRAREAGERLARGVMDGARAGASTRAYQPGAKGLQAYRADRVAAAARNNEPIVIEVPEFGRFAARFVNAEARRTARGEIDADRAFRDILEERR